MKILVCLSLLMTMIFNFSTKAELVRGHVSLEESESLWLPSWLESWLDLDSYLEKGFLVAKIDQGLVDKFICDQGVNDSLIDPQNYLTGEVGGDVKKILVRHSKLSDLPLRVLVCGGDQTVDMSMEALYKRIWGDRKGVLLVYYLGKPLRSQGYVSLGGVGEVGQFEIKELFSKSGRKANERGEVAKQFSVCLEEVSKRLYWIEKEYQVDKSNGLVLPDDELLADEDELVSTKGSSSNLKDKVENWKDGLSLLRAWVIPTLCGFIVSCIVLAVVLAIRRVRPLCYPESSAKSRLCAKSGALSSEVIKFKSIGESIAFQKKDLMLTSCKHY